MSKFKDIEQLDQTELESFFDSSDEITYDFVEAASRSKLPKAFVSRHPYLAAADNTQLVMWARHRTVAKTLADVACSIELSELSVDDTWSKKGKKGCELSFPDGQRVIVESLSSDNSFVETLTEAIDSARKTITPVTYNDDDFVEQEDVFSEEGVAHGDTRFMTGPMVEPEAPVSKQNSKPTSKTPVVTREVIIESLKRANEGAISPTAVKQWAMKVRDYKVIDADEAMVSYILFSLSRIDDSDNDIAQASINEYYERLTVTLV